MSEEKDAYCIQAHDAEIEHRGNKKMVRMDHVALASRHGWDQVIRYCYQLGGRWLGGPPVENGNTGFYFCQVEFEGGTKLEFLEPTDTEGSDFIRRFLDRNGPGPHHITFKVSDFEMALDAVQASGYDLVGIDRSDPDWHQAFLHPKQSHGIVIQLARSGPDEGWTVDARLPPPLRASPAALVTVEHLVADLESATSLFSGPLAMTEIEGGSCADGDHVTLGCGPWRLKLVQPRNPRWQHWLGSRPGRLLQLTFAVTEPGTVPGARPLGDGVYEIAPEQNLGTRLILRSSGGS